MPDEKGTGNNCIERAAMITNEPNKWPKQAKNLMGRQKNGSSDKNLTVLSKITKLFFSNKVDNTAEWILTYQGVENRSEVYARELATLIEVSRNLVSVEQENLLDLILDQLKSVVDYSGAALAQLEGEQLTLLTYRGPDSLAEVIGGPISLANSQVYQQLVQQRTPIVVNNIQEDQLAMRAFQKLTGDQGGAIIDYACSLVIIPLIFKEEVIGVLALGHYQPCYYSAQHVELAVAFANYVALSLGNNQMHRKTRNLAVLAERNRLACELHDNVAQALGYLNLKVAVTSKLLADGQYTEAQANLQELKQVINEAYTDVREEIFNLRAKTSMGLSFLNTLDKYIAKYKQFYNLDIQLTLQTEENQLEFPAEVKEQVIRIIQEALINVRKHAKVDKVAITIKPNGDRVQIMIQDEGQGFAIDGLKKTDKTGFGLEIMQDRAQSINGNLEISSKPGKGTQITLDVPFTC
jgi:signal transduction histidine kinase